MFDQSFKRQAANISIRNTWFLYYNNGSGNEWYVGNRYDQKKKYIYHVDLCAYPQVWLDYKCWNHIKYIVYENK